MESQKSKVKSQKYEDYKNACPPEPTLNSYLTGTLENEERENIEKHIADCSKCLYKIAEAHEVLNEGTFKKIKEFMMKPLKKINYWLVGCIIMFVLSFLIRRFFIQLLVGSTLLGLKWIVDNKNTKMLIMIYDAWKRGGEKEAQNILKSLDERMKR